MTTKSNFTLKAILTTTSPLHITEPSGDRIQLNGRVIYGDNGFPFARTTRMQFNPNPLLTSLSEETAAAENMQRVPVIPANTLGGLLRRRGARLIHDILKARGETLSTNAYNVLECGAASGKPDKKNATVAEIVSAAEHSYFGVFGGGPRLLRRKMRIDTGVAITPDTLAYVDEDLACAVVSRGLCGTSWRRRNDSLLNCVDIDEQSQVIENFLVEVNKYQDLRSGDKAKAPDGQEKESSDSLERFNALEYVNPGVHFAVRLDLEEASAGQAGFMLASFIKVLEQNRIGGHGRLGYGRFMLQKVKIEINGETFALADYLTENKVDVSEKGQELLAAWHELSKTITAAQIEAFASSLDPKDETPKKGRTAKKSEEGIEV